MILIKDGKEKLRGEFDDKRVPLTAYFDGIDIKVKDIEASEYKYAH